MRKFFLALTLFLSTVLPSWGQTITLPAEYKVPVPGLVIIAPTAVDADSVTWISLDKGLEFIPSTLLKDDKTAVGFTLQAGSYRVIAIAAKAKDGKAQQVRADCTVIVGVPPTPIPPGPTPIPPTPVPPTPTPDAAPIPDPGFRVLFVFDPLKLNELSAGQLDAMYSGKVKAYTDAHCVLGPDGKTPEARWWISTANTKDESPLWQKAFARPREVGVAQTPGGKDYKTYNRITGLQYGLYARYEDAVRASNNPLPWVVISNGKTGYEGPIPTSEAAMMELLTKYGG